MCSSLIRIMSWNIHGGIGPDRRFDLERITGLIVRHRPDILALQELDTRGRDPGCLAPLLAVASPAGYLAEARTIIAPDGHYGHALCSRWPLSDIVVHDLSVRRHEPRSAIEVTIATESGPLHAVAVHLGLDIAERWRQARVLARLAGSRRDMPTVMLGDFNDWFPFGSVRKHLAAELPARTSLRTFPARWPTLKLDRIYTNDPASLVREWTDVAASECSDHLPIMAELKLKPI